MPAHSCQEVDTKNYCCIFDCLVKYLHIIPFSFFRLRTNFHTLLLTSPAPPAPCCRWVSLPFVGLRSVGLLKLMQVEVLQSKSLALVSVSWGQKETKKKKTASAPASVFALMQAPLLMEEMGLLLHLHFYGPFCSWWNVVRAVALLLLVPPSVGIPWNPMRHAAFSIHVIPKPCPGVWTSALVQSSNRQMIPHSHLRPQLNPNSKFESESLPKTTVHSQLGAGVALFHWNNKWCP